MKFLDPRRRINHLTACLQPYVAIKSPTPHKQGLYCHLCTYSIEHPQTHLTSTPRNKPKNRPTPTRNTHPDRETPEKGDHLDSPKLTLDPHLRQNDLKLLHPRNHRYYQAFTLRPTHQSIHEGKNGAITPATPMVNMTFLEGPKDSRQLTGTG